MNDKIAQTIISPKPELLKLIVSNDLSVEISVNGCLLIILAVVLLAVMIYYGYVNFCRTNSIEIDEVEFGIGNQKIRLRPNNIDSQIAYKIWVELSTRKIGIQIDLENDVITEVYDSWYQFFGITRELAKEIPVSKFQRQDTQKIVNLSIDILNKGVRPHLTDWQAKFRRWYKQRLIDESTDKTPQAIQKEYPEYKALCDSLIDVNMKLIKYREIMYRLVVGFKSTKSGEN